MLYQYLFNQKSIDNKLFYVDEMKLLEQWKYINSKWKVFNIKEMPRKFLESAIIKTENLINQNKDSLFYKIKLRCLEVERDRRNDFSL